MNIYELQEEFKNLILSKREDDYWDFKKSITPILPICCTILFVFPNDDSLRKMLYLALNNIVKKGTQCYCDWDKVLNHLALLFEDRYAV